MYDEPSTIGDYGGGGHINLTSHRKQREPHRETHGIMVGVLGGTVIIIWSIVLIQIIRLFFR
jgi:hypothetical protein